MSTTIRLSFLVLACGVFLTTGCHRPPAVEPVSDAPVWFEDVTEQARLHFRHDAGPTDGYFMPQIVGSGGAFLDFDGDGLLDILLLQNAGPQSTARYRLFRQRPDHTFEDVSDGSGIDVPGWGMGVAVGDFDNDGSIDVYISQYGGGRLFRNQGKGPGGRWLGFEDVTRSSGVEQPRWGTSCAFFDYNRDGWLDLVVVNYVDYDPSAPCGDASGHGDFCHPRVFPGTATRLFRNRGKDGKGRWLGFEDVTVATGLAAIPGPGLGVICGDFNGDDWPDMLVANDNQPNRLWINQKNGAFKEQAVSRGVATHILGQPQANMGIAWGDVDGNGLADVFITHLVEETHTLWLQEPAGLFRDSTAQSGLAAPHWRGTGWGTVLVDFDHDGWLDLAIVNGRVGRDNPEGGPDLPPFWREYAQRNQLFQNEGKGRFRDISLGNSAFCGTSWVSRALIWGDFDNDGAVDLLVTTTAGPALLYRNVAEKRGHWIGLRAFDKDLKRDVYGARVTVRAGERRWVAEVCPGQSCLASGDARVHFGLGKIKGIDELRVDWPGGPSERFTIEGLDRYVNVVRGKGKKVLP